MKKYVKIMRLDHWIKQLFILPGVLVALALVNERMEILSLCINTVIGFISTSMIASSNYVINGWLDAEFDIYHPTKKERREITKQFTVKQIFTLYILLFIVGITFGLLISSFFAITMLSLWIMGIVYNVKPFRTKDIAYVDILTESINSAIRLLAGWFIVSSSFLPPISIVFGYWFAGAFLMSAKRIAEYRTINNPEIAGMYRKSFKSYTSHSLIILMFLYSMLSALFIGIFLIKYRIELILFIPFYIGLFCYYGYITFKEDSAAQRPEKLYKEKGLMLYIFLLCIVFAITMLIDIPFLDNLLSDALISTI